MRTRRELRALVVQHLEPELQALRRLGVTVTLVAIDESGRHADGSTNAVAVTSDARGPAIMHEHFLQATELLAAGKGIRIIDAKEEN